ncbi:MAG: hypothetical protein M1812_007388 [Candelaria pacifica]|nr:MAG: hypothetical protein M1812_007388 [Candelaria pacifica]
MDSIITTVLASLRSLDLDDPIHQCGASVVELLVARPDDLIRLAHDKLHTYPFKDVPICWRRLYTDASISKAILIMELHSQARRPNVDDFHDLQTDIVRLLDMTIIMTGAPRRRDIIEEIISALQSSGDNSECVEERPSKPQRVNDAFSTDTLPLPKIHQPISKCFRLSMSDFQAHLPTATPIITRYALEHWPALDERPWKRPSYLLKKTFGGRRLVPVEIGRSYTDEGWGQSIITFKEFLEHYLLAKPDKVGYLAQHDLFSQVPSLRNDICIPDYCYTNPPKPAKGTPLAKQDIAQLEEPLLNAWFGPAGTISPLHTDPYHNILCQVVGKKYVRLYSPYKTDKLYPRGIEEGGVDMSNTSQIDITAMEDPNGDRSLHVKFPLFREAEYFDCILDEGECLYIPVGWWHYVRSLSVSFSVSFWWN